MFPKTRRFKQELQESEVIRILQTATSGTLSLIDGNGYPYAVPLSFVYTNGKIYFHSAKSGHKIDAIKHCKRASFCVIDKDDVQPEKYTTYYKSVISFGNAEIIEDNKEAAFAIRKLGGKYYPDHNDELQKEIEKHKAAFVIIKFEIEHLTGKQSRETV